MGEQRIIQLGIPEGFDADEVVVTLHRRIPPYGGIEGTVIKPPLKDGPPAKAIKEIKLLSQGKEERVCPCGVKFIPKKKNQKYHDHACCVKFGNAKRYKKSKQPKHIYRLWNDAYIIQNFGVIPLAMMSEHLGIEIKPLQKHVDYLKRKGQIKNEVTNAGTPRRTHSTHKGQKYRTFSAEEREYVEAHMGDESAAIAAHLGFKKQAIQDLKYRIRKARGEINKTDDKVPCQFCGTATESAPPEDPTATPETILPAAVKGDAEKGEPWYKFNFKPKKSQPPDDFDPKQRFGEGCYL